MTTRCLTYVGTQMLHGLRTDFTAMGVDPQSPDAFHPFDIVRSFSSLGLELSNIRQLYIHASEGGSRKGQQVRYRHCNPSKQPQSKAHW